MARPVRVLAVDDSLTMRKLLEVVFAGPSFELTLTVNGSEAIVAASRTQPDILVMDYVLPDMRGIDICVALSRNDATKALPIVVTSAKGAKVLDEFKSYPSVIGFVPKPFKPAELRTVVTDALRRLPKPEAEPVVAAKPARIETPKQSHAELEKIARALFTALAPTFSKMPEWVAEMGAERADRFLARKVLTPKLIEGLLEALQPFAAPSEPTPCDIAGSTELMPLFDVFSVLARGKRTGVLQLASDGASTQVFFRRGELIGATHSDPTVYLGGLDSSGWKLAPEVFQRAGEAHRRGGPPVLVALAEAGVFPMTQLSALLKEASRTTLVRALESNWRFRWSQLVLPSFVDAHGTPTSIDSLRLVHLRRQEVDEPGGEWSPSQLLIRQPGFSERARTVELDADERRVLTLINNRHLLRDVVERSGLDGSLALRVVRRLSKVGLIAGTSGSVTESSVKEQRRRRVVLYDPDRTADASSLTRRLSGPHSARDLVCIETAEQLQTHLDGALDALIVNCSSLGIDGAELARKVRTSLQIADATLIGVVESGDGARAAALRGAGFDGVLVKPFLLDELDALLAAA
jgi:DNA-binding response OmpR family regulator